LPWKQTGNSKVIHVLTDHRSLMTGLLLLLSLVFNGPAMSQNCSGYRPDGPHGYSLRTNGDRCEGFYQQPVAGATGVSILSLTYGAIAFDTARHSQLVVRLPAEPDGIVYLLGQHVPLTRFYRLEAELRPGRATLEVPLADVIRPAAIAPRDLGLYAFRPLPGALREFIPVIVQTDAALPAQMTGRLRMVLRPSIDVQNLRWRLRPPGGQASEWRSVPGGEGLVALGTPLPFDLEPMSIGRTTMELRFFDRSGMELTDVIRLAAR
jgi:hypothetical protein